MYRIMNFLPKTPKPRESLYYYNLSDLNRDMVKEAVNKLVF